MLPMLTPLSITSPECQGNVELLSPGQAVKGRVSKERTRRRRLEIRELGGSRDPACLAERQSVWRRHVCAQDGRRESTQEPEGRTPKCESPGFLGPGYDKDPIRLIYPTPARSCLNAPIEFARVLAVCVLSFFQSSSASFPVIPSLRRSER